MNAEDCIPDGCVAVASVSVASYIDVGSGEMHFCSVTSGDASLSTMIGLHMFGVLELWDSTREERSSDAC